MFPSQPINVPDDARNKLHHVITTNGLQLTKQVVLAIAGVLPPARVRFLVSILKLLLEVDIQACAQWVDSAVRALPAGYHCWVVS